MFKIYSQGDPIFMGILSIILLALLVVFLMCVVNKGDEKQLNQSEQFLKILGTLALVIGIFGQLLGLYNALEVMQNVQGVSPAILYGGIKVSMISTLYGLLIFIVYLICTMILKRVL